jgi:hypothetical protein
MSNPQQPELARSRKTPAQDPDAASAVLDGQSRPGTDAPGGPVPPDNQPGHHPPKEQDKPDLQAFAERLGTAPSPGDDAGATPSAVTSARAGRWGLVALAAVVLVVLGVVAGRRRGWQRSR